MDKEIKKNPRGLHCLAIGGVWEMAKELADKEGRKVSSLIRELIKREYERREKTS